MLLKNISLLSSLDYICNMKYIYIFFVVIFLSCCKEDISSQSNVLSEKMFVNIIKDIHLNEAKFDNLKRIDFEKYKSLQSNSRNSVFLKYKISHEDFQQSMLYYSSKPEKLERIYSLAIDEIKHEDLIIP